MRLLASVCVCVCVNHISVIRLLPAMAQNGLLTRIVHHSALSSHRFFLDNLRFACTVTKPRQVVPVHYLCTLSWICQSLASITVCAPRSVILQTYSRVFFDIFSWLYPKFQTPQPRDKDVWFVLVRAATETPLDVCPQETLTWTQQVGH